MSKPKRLVRDGLLPNPVQTIGKPDADPELVINITSLRYIGSYNWVKTSSPTILVRGSPPKWRDRKTPFNVKRDRNTSIDENARRIPSMPLLPLVRAVDINAEVQGRGAFDWSSVDIITDRNNLRKLLRWACRSTNQVFRIDTQLAGDGSVLFTRWNERDKGGGDGSSYGCNFEKASTIPAKGCNVNQDLDGLRMIVRFEVDAHISASGLKATHRDPVDATHSSRVSSELGSSSFNNGSYLTVVRGGSPVPQSSLVELKAESVTKSAHDNLSAHYPQLYLSQTPHIFVATHSWGNFHRVRKWHLDSLTRIAQIFTDRLKKLRRALEVIREVVIASGKSGRLILVLKDGELTVFERISKASCLPPEILARF